MDGRDRARRQRDDPLLPHGASGRPSRSASRSPPARSSAGSGPAATRPARTCTSRCTSTTTGPAPARSTRSPSCASAARRWAVRSDRRADAGPVRRPPGLGAAAPAAGRADTGDDGRAACAAAGCSIGLPGLGWRGDLRADEKVVQGSRTYVPVMPEHEWYRAEAEQIEVFAPLVPVERVWVEETGMAGVGAAGDRRARPAGVAGRAAAPGARRRPRRRRADRPPGRPAPRRRRRTARPASRHRAAHQRRRRHLRPGRPPSWTGTAGRGAAGRPRPWRCRSTCSGWSEPLRTTLWRRRPASRLRRRRRNCPALGATTAGCRRTIPAMIESASPLLCVGRPAHASGDSR